jgi:hypothetical protein
MRRLFTLILSGTGLFGLITCPSWAAPQGLGNTSPTAEELQVYGDFVELMSKAHFSFLSDRTFPLDLSNLPKDSPCLRGIRLEGAEAAAKESHVLGQQVLRGTTIRLTNAEQESAILRQRDADGVNLRRDASGMMADLGVLTLSEIVFDETHHFAIMRYVFICGSHCNSGAILVLEKVGSRWTATTRRPCKFMPTQDNPRK